MPPVSHPFKKGKLVILMNYNDHAPPHVHVKYQNDMGSYRIEIRSRKWMKSDKALPLTLKKMVESWVEAHEKELLEQWQNAESRTPVKIVG
jgi:hypothetical protein